MKLDGWQYPLALLFVIICASGFALHPPKESADVAAWVGAVGTIAAIGGAVWVGNHQYERARQDDIDETRAFVQAVYEEMQNIWQAYDGEVGPMLRGLPAGQFLNIIFPVGNDLFTVYNGSSSRVGKVEDAELRKLIVTVYGKSKGIVYSFLLNNQLVTDYFNFAAMYHGPNRDEVMAHKLARLVDYMPKLQARDREVTQHVNAFFRRAEHWLRETEHVR